MKKNAELLRELRDHLAYNPTRHHQSYWSAAPRRAIDTNTKVKDSYYPATCGTSACCAGWAVMLAGDRLLVSEDELRYAKAERRVAYANYCQGTNGRIYYIPTRARVVLGLSEHETDKLFAANTPRKQVLEILDGYIKEAEQ